MGYSLGVDLGTTFVAAAVAHASTIEMFTLSDRSVVSPAVVYLREDGTLVTGEAATLRAVSNPDRVGREFKRRLGNPTPVILGGQPHAVTALLGTLLRDVLQKVIETEGGPPDHIMLTHPANWGPFRRALFEEVPQHAGLADPAMVTEPEAAAAHYTASRQLNDGDIVAVYDLGGGTFDATVLRKQPGGVEILGTPEGIERLGGVDFDEAILNYVDYTAGGALRELDMRDQQTTVALARLRQDCILAKEALSVDTETVLPVFLPGRHFDVHLTRSDFEDMVRAQIESTIGALSRTLQSAQVDPADLSAVLLVGGSSRIPLVARMVSAELGRPTVVDTHPKYAVALGAATLAAQISSFNGSQFAFDGRPHGGRPAAVGSAPPAATPPPPAAGNAIAGARTPQRDARPFVPAVSSAAVVPPPRTPPRDTVATPARTVLEDGPTGPDSLTVQSPAPLGQPRRPQPVPTVDTVDTMLPDNRYPGPETRQAGFGSPGLGGSRSAPNTVNVTENAFPGPPLPGFLPPGSLPPGSLPPGSSPDRERRRRALISGGALLAVVGMIALVVFAVVAGINRIQESAGGDALTVVPVPTSAPIAQTPATAVPIPALGPTIPAGKTPVFVVVSPNGRQAYIANDKEQIVTVVDTAINQVTATIQISAGPPQFLAFAPDGRTLYVTIFNDQKTIHEIAVVDIASLKVVATIPQEPRPFLPAVSPDGKLLYVPNHDVDSVAVVSTNDNKVITQIKVAPNPHWVVFSRDGTRAYTANHDSNVISVIDTATHKVLTTVPVGTSPHSLAVSPNRPILANVNFDSNNVTVIDTGTLKILATIPVGKTPRDIVWSPDGRFAYVVNADTNNVSVIDAATYKVTATIPVGAGPMSIAVRPDGRQAYVSNKGGGTLTVLELAG